MSFELSELLSLLIYHLTQSVLLLLLVLVAVVLALIWMVRQAHVFVVKGNGTVTGVAISGSYYGRYLRNVPIMHRK